MLNFLTLYFWIKDINGSFQKQIHDIKYDNHYLIDSFVLRIKKNYSSEWQKQRINNVSSTKKLLHVFNELRT